MFGANEAEEDCVLGTGGGVRNSDDRGEGRVRDRHAR